MMHSMCFLKTWNTWKQDAPDMVGYIKSFEESQGGAPATWRAEFGGGKYQQKYGHSKVQKIYHGFLFGLFALQDLFFLG